MKQFIFGEKILHIIDLTQTVTFKNALVQIHKCISSGGKYPCINKTSLSK